MGINHTRMGTMKELSTNDIFTGELPVDRIIKRLEETFPNSTPQPSDSINDIMFRSGQQSVIEFIKQEFTED